MPFEHYCVVCGEWGAFGVDVRLSASKPGTWYCFEHWPGLTAGKVGTAPPTVPPPDVPDDDSDDLFVRQKRDRKDLFDF